MKPSNKPVGDAIEAVRPIGHVGNNQFGIVIADQRLAVTTYAAAGVSAR